MNIESFLQFRGTNLASVLDIVEDEIGLQPDDCLFGVGSLAENMGNSKSDLDLLLITNRKVDFETSENKAIIVGNCLVDVKIFREKALNELLERFEQWKNLAWQLAYAVDFTLEERTLLHRLLHGRLLFQGKSNYFKEKLPSKSELARLKLHVARQMSKTIQVDMVGYLETSDYRSLLLAAQEVLGHAFDALLAGYGLTNPLIKWRSRLLDAVPSNWEKSLLLRPTNLSAGDYFWQMKCLPQQPDRVTALEHSLRITTFARTVFTWAESCLIDGCDPFLESIDWASVDWSTVRFNSNEARLPFMTFDVDFFLAGKRVLISRINEFKEIIELSPNEFALILLCDGTTPIREASKLISGSLKTNQELNDYEELIKQISRLGFAISLHEN